jgi:hypothetical protein
MALAYLTINLDAFTGDDHPPISQYSTITLDPGADHIDEDADVIHVRTIVVSLDQQGKAATANGVPCVDGRVPVVAGVAYAVSAPNILRGGPHYIPALTAGQVVDLSDYITPGAPLTPDQAAILTARIKALETTPPDHGALTGLGDDDHPQYLTTGRGDERYVQGSDSRLTLADTAVQPADLNAYATDAELTAGLVTKADASHSHTIADTTGLQTALDGKAATSHTHTGVYAPALGADDNYVTDAEKAALHTHPAVIAQGATQADARTAIGLGSAATTASTAYATAAQGTTADAALAAVAAEAAARGAALGGKVDKGALAIEPTGMVADDATDARASIQAALNVGATFASRREVRLPAGTFYLATSLDIDRPVHIRGAGRDNTVVRIGVSAFKALSDNVTIEGITFKATTDKWLMNTQASGASFKGWKFRDCVFDKVGLNLSACGRDMGNGSTEATGTRVAVNPVVDGCEFFGYAGNETMYIAGTTGAHITDCHIHDCGTDTASGEGIKVLHNATGTVIDGCLVERTTRDGIDAYNAIATTISNCVIRDPGVNGIEIKWATTDTTLCRENTFVGNRVERAGSAGYNLDAPKTIAVGNVALSCTGSGFRFSSSTDGGLVGTDGGTFIGNQALNGSADGFLGGALALNNSLVGNIALGNTGIGFNVVGGQVMGFNAASGNTAGNYPASSMQNIKAFIGNLGSATPGEARLANNVPFMSYLTNGNVMDLLKLSSSNVVLVGTTASGGPSLRLQAPSGSLIESVGRFLPAVTNTYDLGGSAAKWKDLYMAGVIKTAAVATGSRPTAAIAGAGGQMYDTTLSKPIWSDGTVWRDAAGTAV